MHLYPAAIWGLLFQPPPHPLHSIKGGPNPKLSSSLPRFLDASLPISLSYKAPFQIKKTIEPEDWKASVPTPSSLGQMLLQIPCKPESWAAALACQ